MPDKFRILVAPNAFKESLSALKAARAISEGLQKACPHPEIIISPISDGGDGLVDVILEISGGETVECEVRDPLGRKIIAAYAYLADPRVAVIEMARASGLALLRPEEKNPMKASTAGMGELMLDAVRKGAEKIILGIGGSATNDAATGAAEIFGWKFLDSDGGQLKASGESLSRIRKMIAPENNGLSRKISVDVVCDVDNPLIGPNGAARVYAPQKGASEKDVEELEAGLANFAKLAENQLGMRVAEMKGAGAAGGTGAGMKAFFGAELKNGAKIVFELLQIEDKIAGADLVITGEGRIDSQTVFGKAPAEIAKLAKKHGIPCVAICGSKTGDIDSLYDAGITSVFSICPGPVSLDFAMKNTESLLRDTAFQILRTALSSKSI